MFKNNTYLGSWEEDEVLVGGESLLLCIQFSDAENTC